MNIKNPNKNLKYNENKLKKIYLAGGCFWGIEEYFSKILGVAKTLVGYSNGKTKNPSYEDVCSGETGHVEAVEVTYDENIVSLDFLIKEFFKIINPSTLNQQGAFSFIKIYSFRRT